MGRAIVPALLQVVVDGAADAGTGVASPAAPIAAGVPLAAVFAVMALACSSAAVGTLIINRFARLRRPAVHDTSGPTPVPLDGIPAVAFVSKEYTARWISATVFRLASEGVIAVVDERRPVLQSWDEAVEHIQLEFTGDPTAVGSARRARRCGLRGRVRAVRRFPQRGRRAEAFEPVRWRSRWRIWGKLSSHEPRRSSAQWGRRHTGSHGPPAALASRSCSSLQRRGTPGALALGWFAILAMLMGAGALIGSVLILRMRMLNADGIALRDGIARRREILEESTFRSVSVGERVLPWAVMFDLPSLAERLGAVAQLSGISPQWYRSDAPFTAARFISCVDAVQLRMMPTARFAVSDSGEFTALYAWQVGGGDGGGGFGGFGDFGGESRRRRRRRRRGRRWWWRLRTRS